MRNLLLSLASITLASASLVACTIENVPPPEAPAAPAPAAPAPVAGPIDVTPAPAAPAPAAAAPAPAPAATTAPPAAAAAPDPNSIDACCTALNAVKTSGRGTEAKSKSVQAAQLCPGVARLVRDGRTPRAAALTQIVSSLNGVEVPAECK